MPLEDVRREVARVDDEIIACLARRQSLAEEAVAAGQSADETMDPVHHACFLARVQARAIEAGVSPALAQGVYLAILHDAIARQLKLLGAPNGERPVKP